MSLDSMEIFVKLVETRSFTKAAAELQIPKSTVSLRLTQLESALGVQLLKRTTRMVNPTEAGALYYEHCRRIVADAREANSLLQSLQNSVSGLVRVAALPDLGYFISEMFLPKFLIENPAVEVELTIVRTPKDALFEGMDLGIQLGAVQDENLVSRKLGSLQRELFASPGYIERMGRLEAPEQAAQHRFVLQTHEMTGIDRSSWKMKSEKRSAVVTGATAMTCNSLRVMRHIAAGGAGIALLPRMLFGPDIKAGILENVLAGWATDTLDVTAVWASRRYLSARSRLFLDALIESNLFAALPGD